MANNRMFLGCKICGACHYLAKWYPGTPWSANNPEKRGDMLNKFLEDHIHYDDNKRNDDDDEEYFEIVYESCTSLTYNQKDEKPISYYVPIRE